MNDRLRAVATSVATVALFALTTAILPSATASAQSSMTGSAAEPEQGQLAGTNDWECEPSPEHPRPVVLVHGTGRSMQESWGNTENPSDKGPLIKPLKDDGYCVFALNYGFAPSLFLGPTPIPAGRDWWGHAAIEDAAVELAEFIDKVRTETGSAQVDVVGHSQGGTVTRQYLRFAGGADQQNPANSKVHTLVMLAPSTHGTSYRDQYPTVEAARAAGASKSSQQQIIGSEFLATLNAGQETFPGIDYTVIASKTDRTITPYTGSFLDAAPGPSLRNVYVQDECQDQDLFVGHSRKSFDTGPNPQVGLLEHPAPVFLARKALDPNLQGTIPCS
ncbi:esterase/lipase family protein [Rhodococcus oryzae]|uniref:esterase/lipase family protein n=1 Tax=Rhodococcus oryzae TaxID=2571143 RepID=UPI003788EA19